MFRLWRDRLGFLTDVASRYGDVASFRIGDVPYALLNHPDHVRDVLVTRAKSFHKGLGLQRARLLLGDGLLTSEDEHHARQRRLIQPAFHRERIAAYGETMVACTERRSASWVPGRAIDVAAEMAGITLAIAGRTLFAAEVDEDSERIRQSLERALLAFSFALMPYGDRLLKLPIPAARRFSEARQSLDDTVYRLIRARRSAGSTGRDLLSMLVEARDGLDDHAGMPDEQIRDEVLTLLLAGHETTANALGWTWHLLTAHPDIERALHAEVDQVLGGRLPTADDVPQLPYTRAVLAESMRLFPPAYVVGRRTLAPFDVHGTDYRLPQGTVVLISQYLLHRDPRFWDDPADFHPERWLAGDGRDAARVRYAYFPFGAGPRICVGEQFAWMEGVLALATVARRWRFEPVSGRRPVTPQAIITLRPRHGIQVRPIERR